jgi:PAS domain S-box-containing protein
MRRGVDSSSMHGDARFSESAIEVEESSRRVISENERHVAFAADSLGSLRRELIEHLGPETARGILTRAAYESGCVDARRVRERYPEPLPEDLLRTGHGFYDLGGRARVRLTRVDINRVDGKFHVVGDWLDSSEAEQHVKHFGSSARTVCWTLEGYVAGYASELLGREALCMETRCRGRGDSVCSFELKPREDWGEAGKKLAGMLAEARPAGRVEGCLRNISERGCALEQSLPDAVLTLGVDATIRSCSQGGHDLFGSRPADIIGMNLGHFLAGGRGEANRITERLRCDGKIRNYVTEFVMPVGRRVPVAMAAYAVRDPGGEMLGAVGVAHDLTDVRRLEDELAAKNRFMANILQDSADAIITMDPESIVTSWNRGAESIFGYTADEAVGQHIDIIMPAEMRSTRELDALTEKLRTHGAVRSYQTECVTKDGRRIQAIFTRTAVWDDSGNYTGSSVVLKDVTATRNLERQLADAEHLATLGELSAGLAHEVKNPLAGIKGAIDVIRDTLPVADVHREILGDVLHEVNRIDQIVRDLLNYAKPRIPSHADINLAEMAQRMVAMARQSAKDDRIAIRLDVQDAIPGFTGDQTQLEQVLLNLLLNARKATRAGGRIDVRLSCDSAEGAVRVEVEDNGAGISEEIRKKIFQPFFTTRTDGTGLGLAICLKNVQYHGGTIDVESEVGKGTRFIVTLPLISRL